LSVAAGTAGTAGTSTSGFFVVTFSVVATSVSASVVASVAASVVASVVAFVVVVDVVVRREAVAVFPLDEDGKFDEAPNLHVPVPNDS